MINQFYLGCETPLPRLFSTPGFTEASARAALGLQDMLIKPSSGTSNVKSKKKSLLQSSLRQDLTPPRLKVRLIFGSPETPELVPADLMRAAELGLVRAEEFRKNAVKFGWELWDSKETAAPKGGA
jgi:hypothetical protein